ncbi:MAG TPA: hypothetical protein DIS79_00155 [Bacteroidetes bacterium]|nr:hypothetical protein [Bacteroidota bacterium]
MWAAVVEPVRIPDVRTATALSMFAVAVLLVTAASTCFQYLEAQDATLARHAEALATRLGAPEQPTTTTEGVDLSSPQRAFTAILGITLLREVVSMVAMAGVLLGLMRFMTNADLGFGAAISSVAATAFIQILGAGVTTLFHLITHDMRWGLHAGIFIEPMSSPFLFAFLQRVDVAALWQYVAAAVGMASWAGLDRRYGIIVGTVSWATILIVVFGGMSLLSWIMSTSVR